MRPSFDDIRRQDDIGKEYWSSRDLCVTMGYSAYWESQNLIDKAIKVAGDKDMEPDDHFNQAVKMVKTGNGAFRKVSLSRLSRMACMIHGREYRWEKALTEKATIRKNQDSSIRKRKEE